MPSFCVHDVMNANWQMISCTLQKKKKVFLSCGLSRFNLCMPFVYSNWSCQTLTYICVESDGCHCCWPWDWLKQPAVKLGCTRASETI